MHETMEKTKKICEMRCHLENYIYPLMTCGENVMSVEHGGEFIDMIKDLAEAEKDLWKACYYKKMAMGLEPMVTYAPSEHDKHRMGYDNWRYSSGKFAPTGHGHRSGYMPDEEMYDGLGNLMSPLFMDKSMRQGYDGMGREDDRYGRAYNNWKNSRRGYTQTHSTADKQDMDSHAKEHMMDMLNTTTEIWGDADPELRKKMVMDMFGVFKTMCKTSDPETKKKVKADLTSLMTEMG